MDIKSFFCACTLFFLLSWGNSSMAQAPFLEVIGGTDVELMACLGKIAKEQTIIQKGDRIEITGKNLKIIYNMRKGKVISLKYKEFFASQEEAVTKYNTYMSHLYSEGVPLRQVRNADSLRITRGYGGGVEADLTVMPVNERYLLDAEVMLIN